MAPERALTAGLGAAQESPSPSLAAPPQTKGDTSSGSKSFYYLIIPSVVPEIPLWSLYSPQWVVVVMGEDRDGGVRDYLQSREGTTA